MLYLPTWEGFCVEQAYSSLDMVLQNIKKLQDNSSFQKMNISIKLHPLSGKKGKKIFKIRVFIK